MKVRLLLILTGLISFAVPASIAQDAMKVVMADDVVWKDYSLFKGVQIANLLGDPAKAETVVMRVKFPPNFKIPLHTHLVTEVITVLSGTFWDAMGDDTEKGVMLKPGSLLVLPANHTHRANLRVLRTIDFETKHAKTEAGDLSTNSPSRIPTYL
jgi:quercetin dioxygenase-like cupin family protein